MVAAATTLNFMGGGSFSWAILFTRKETFVTPLVVAAEGVADLRENHEISIPNLYSTPCPGGGEGVTLSEFHKDVYNLENYNDWPAICWRKCDDTLSTFVPEKYNTRQTDGQTELLYQYRTPALLCWCAIIIIIIARQHTDTWYVYSNSVRPSGCLSVRHVPV